MKKVKGYISVRALGCYDFEFFVDDDATGEEIKRKVEQHAEYDINYDVEGGYEAVQETVYRKKSNF